MKPCLRCVDVSKAFGRLKVLHKLNIEIGMGEFVSLLGPSGSGKTTLLMLVAGFQNPDEGAIWHGDRRIERLPPYKRNMGVVFQNYALFPHLTVFENIAFPLQMRRETREQIRLKVDRALEMVELRDMGSRKPAQLSGGQQQRIALARALVFEPEVVLMDEPFGALDRRLREQMQLDIRSLHKRLGLTIIFVTHDQAEAMTMSDRIAVFNDGDIRQIGSPKDIYDRPASRFVAEFMGETNVLSGEVITADTQATHVRLQSGETIRISGRHSEIGQRVSMSVRPERVLLGAVDHENTLTARVVDSVYLGDHDRVQLDTPSGEIIAKHSRRRGPVSAGDMVSVSFASQDCWIIPG